MKAEDKDKRLIKANISRGNRKRKSNNDRNNRSTNKKEKPHADEYKDYTTYYLLSTSTSHQHSYDEAIKKKYRHDRIQNDLSNINK